MLAGLNDGTDYDWFGEATGPGYISDHLISIRGSSETTSYYISGGYTKQKGWMLNDNYERKSARINLDTEVASWLKVGVNTFGAFSDYSGESPTLDQLVYISPLAKPRDENGELIINPLGNNVVNPFLASSTDDKDIRNNISGVAYAILNIPSIEGLTLSGLTLVTITGGGFTAIQIDTALA